MDNSFNFKGILNKLLIPFIVLIVIYVICLLIYSIKNKKKNNPRYVYIINFNLYVIGIMIGTFCVSMSSIYFVFKLKIDKVFDYTSFGFLFFFLLGLIVMFIMFVKATRKDEKEEIKDYQKNKELKLMVNEIKTTKIEKKKKTPKKEKYVQVVEIVDNQQVKENKEKSKKDIIKVKENDEIIEIELL